jgi:hypothetical protein
MWVAAPSAPRSTSGTPKVASSAGHDDVGVADQADATADAEAVDRGDDGDGALVHGLEGGEAALVRADQGVEALGVLHLLDVDAGVEAACPPPGGRRPSHLGVGAGRSGGRPGRTNLHGQRVDRGERHRDDRGDAVRSSTVWVVGIRLHPPRGARASF